MPTAVLVDGTFFIKRFRTSMSRRFKPTRSPKASATITLLYVPINILDMLISFAN